MIPPSTFTYSEDKSDMFHGDTWFASVSTVESIESIGHTFKFIVKTFHRKFVKSYLQYKMNYFPDGMHLDTDSDSTGKLFMISGISIT